MKYIFKHFQTLGWLSKTFSASVFMASGKHCLYIPGLGSSTVDQVLKYTKYPKYISSTSTGQVLIFLKKYLSTSSTFISSTSTHIKKLF